MFTVEERIGFIQESRGGLGNVEVEGFATLVVDFARAHGARCDREGAARGVGLRVGVPDEQPQPGAGARDRDDVPDGSPQYSFLSSRGVREIASFGGPVAEYVPEPVARRLERDARTAAIRSRKGR